MSEIELAYIDPGSASVLITAVLGSLGAIAYSFRKAFYQLRERIFGRASSNERQQEQPKSE